MTSWKLFPHFIVRTTGFPFDLVEQLRCLRTGEAAKRCVEASGILDRLRQNAPPIRHPPRSVLAAFKANRVVPLEQLDNPEVFTEWNVHARVLAEAQAEFDRAFLEESDRIAGRVREIATEPRFLEAIASSSPPIYMDLVRGRWSTRVERQVASYVQRLAAKNETMSFFGPINYGRFEPEAEDRVGLVWSGPTRLRRRTHAASWLVQGVVSQISFDPAIAPWLVLRRKGFAKPPLQRERRKLGEILIGLGHLTPPQLARALALQPGAGRKLGELVVEAQFCTPGDVERALTVQAEGKQPANVATSEQLARFVEAADGTKLLSRLAEELGLPLEEAISLARTACEKRLLTHQLEVPSAAYLPLNDLVERLSGIPGPIVRTHLEGLDEVLERMSRYSAADASEKVRLLTEMREQVEARWGVRSPFAPPPQGAPPSAERRRSDGQFYADRLPMREECGGDLRLRISGARAREFIAQLDRPLDLMARAAELTRQAARRKVAELLGTRRVPFWKVVAALSEQAIPYDTSLNALVSRTVSPEAKHAAIDPAALPAIPPPDGVPLICSVDVLISAKDVGAFERGECQLVMGDLHDTAQVWGWALQFLEDRVQVETDMVRLIGRAQRSIPVVTVLASRRTGLLPSEFPGPVVELGGVSVRPSPWRLPFDDLWVVSDGTDAKLWSDRFGGEVLLYNGELESLVHTAFALPRIRAPKVDLGAHTPRLTVDGVVIQREQWQMPAAWVEEMVACKDDRARLRSAARGWAALGLPTYVFAKFPGERKPILVCPDSPPLVRAFATMLEDKGSVMLSEMTPSPDQLWLQSELGRHTGELRCTFIRVAG